MNICKICSKETKNAKDFSNHLIHKHKIEYLKYYVEYESFKIPKCLYCLEDCKYKSGLFFRKTCSREECVKKLLCTRRFSDEQKLRASVRQKKYLKENPDKTAWRQKNPSWPERRFENILERAGLHKEFLIIKERCIYPYYIDFAFEDLKVAIEIDGSQHELPEAKIRDRKKEELLLENGWRILRFTASQVQTDPDNVLLELNLFLNSPNKTYNRVGIYSSMDLKKEQQLKKKQKRTEEKELIKDLVLKSGIKANKRGGIIKLSKILKYTPQSTGRWLRKNMPELFKQ